MTEWKFDTPLNLLDSMYGCNTLTGYGDLRGMIMQLEEDSKLLKGLLEMLEGVGYIYESFHNEFGSTYEFDTGMNDMPWPKRGTQREAIEAAIQEWKKG